MNKYLLHHCRTNLTFWATGHRRLSAAIGSCSKRWKQHNQGKRNESLCFKQGFYAKLCQSFGTISPVDFRLLGIISAAFLMLAATNTWGQGIWHPLAEPPQQSEAIYSEPECGGYVPLGSQCEAWDSRWLGAYAGAYYSGGAGLGAIERPVGDDFTIDNGGSHVGGLIGYNFGCSPMSAGSGWLWGTELELTALGGSETKNDPVFGNVKIDGSWMASLQLRGGYAWENTYLFATAGVAMSDIDVMASTQNSDSVRTGWACGVGVEQKLNHAWSARLDAVGYGFGSKNIDLGGSKRKVGIGAGQIRLGIIKRF